MKTFLQYIFGDKKEKTSKGPQYKGTPVVVDTHGSHAQDEPIVYKGTPVLVDTHGTHSKQHRKKLDEKYDSNGNPVQPRTFEHPKAWQEINDNSHLGGELPDIHHRLTAFHPFHDFADSHRSAVKEYTTDSSQLNQKLLRSYLLKRAPEDKIHRHNISHLDGAVKHHKLGHDLHVYSGVGFHPGEKAAEDPENKIHLPSYTSTSVNKNTAIVFSKPLDNMGRDQANHVLHIHLKKGQKGLYVGDHSEIGNEHEYLMPRNTTLKINPTPTILPRGSHFANNAPVHVWHAHVAPNEPADPRQLPLNFGGNEANSELKRRGTKS